MRGWVRSATLAGAIAIAAVSGVAPHAAHAYVDTDDPLDPFGPGYTPPAAPPKPRRPPPKPPADSKAVGYLLVYSTPFAHIHIDGKDTGKTTPISSRGRIALAPGKHKLMFVVPTADGDERYTFTITIRAGETLKIVKQLPVTTD